MCDVVWTNVIHHFVSIVVCCIMVVWCQILGVVLYAG